MKDKIETKLNRAGFVIFKCPYCNDTIVLTSEWLQVIFPPPSPYWDNFINFNTPLEIDYHCEYCGNKFVVKITKEENEKEEEK
ncbi:MAG: hypothetical protein N2323_06580 [candidate division WOR-3 bacterium]|nr:hypothetical protein [candidate division WOR-3 bacterium]